MKKRRIFSGVIYFLIVIVTGLTMYVLHHMNTVNPEYRYLNENWTVTGTQTGQNVDLSTFVLDRVHRGDEYLFTCENPMPQTDIMNPTLRIYSVHAAVQVKLDDDVIYEYGFDRFEKKKLLGFGIQLISLPEDYEGKTLSIFMKVSEDNAFSDVQVPFICDGSRFIKDMCIQKKSTLAANLFLLVFGMLLFGTSAVFCLVNRRFKKLACIGLFSAIISVWSICNSDLITIFTYSLEMKAYLEFFSLYCCTVPLLLYFGDVIYNKKKDWIAKLYYMLLTVQIIFIIIISLAQLMAWFSFPKVLVVQHVLFLIFAIFVISICVRDFATRQFKHVPIAIGISGLLLTGIVDIIRFNLEKYVFIFQGYSYTSLISFGTLFFIILQLIDFFKNISDELVRAAHAEAMERLAYTDDLTGIYNRRKCEEEFDLIDQTKDSCGIFSFDLNDLKKVNDTYGHEKGDELIRCFANTLQEIFAGRGIVCRMGGDEFIAIIRNPMSDESKLYSKKVIELFKENQKILNIDIEVSTAIGYAYTNLEKNRGIKQTLRKADARLYKNKSFIKSNK